MYAFYFTGITDFQDMLTTLLSAIKSGKECWVCLFDCLKEKRQFYYYEKNELIDFIKSVCKNNEVALPKIDFYGQDQKERFNLDFDKNKPKVVFLQNTWHRSPLWYPKTGESKVVQFAWGQDSVHRLKQAKYSPSLLVLRRAEDEKAYANCGIPAKYFGDLKLESLLYNPVITTPFPEKSFSCYISESFVSKTGKREQTGNLDNKSYGKQIDKILKCLKENGVFSIWKKREKGYPTKKWGSPLEYCKLSPDLVIDKDLNFPSAVISGPLASNVCIFAGWSSSYHMAKTVNENVLLLDVNKGIERQIVDFIADLKPRLKIQEKSIDSPSIELLSAVSEIV